MDCWSYWSSGGLTNRTDCIGSLYRLILYYLLDYTDLRLAFGAESKKCAYVFVDIGAVSSLTLRLDGKLSYTTGDITGVAPPLKRGFRGTELSHRYTMEKPINTLPDLDLGSYTQKWHLQPPDSQSSHI